MLGITGCEQFETERTGQSRVESIALHNTKGINHLKGMPKTPNRETNIESTFAVLHEWIGFAMKSRPVIMRAVCLCLCLCSDSLRLHERLTVSECCIFIIFRQIMTNRE